MHIRLWDGDTVRTRYLNSHFLQQAASVDINECFKDLDNEIQPLENMLQVSMDGPNVNLKAHRELKKWLQEKYGHELLDVGTCPLHQVHNSLKAAMDTNSFKMQQFLRSLYNLFHDAPARRGEFTLLTGSSKFPQSFATHRWADNRRAAERAVDMFPSLEKFCNAVESKTKGVTQITSQSYKNVIKFVLHDKFALVKLEFFISLCRKIEPFLTLFQTDRPMAPFIVAELDDLVLQLARRFMKPQYCSNRKTDTLKKLELKNENYIELKNIDLGRQAKKLLDALLDSESVSEKEHEDMLKACRDAMVNFIAKLQNKSPSNHELAKNINCIDPKFIYNNPIKAVDNFRKALDCATEAKLLSERDYDMAYEQFQRFVDQKHSKPEFKDFNFRSAEHRIDSLFYKEMFGKAEFSFAWDFIAQLLLISHGQAAVERGFSINKHASFTNQHEDSLVARRVVKDYVDYVGGIENVAVSEPLNRAVMGAGVRYKEHLKEKEKVKVQSAKEKSRQIIKTEITAKKSEIENKEKLVEYTEKELSKHLKMCASDKVEVFNATVALTVAGDFQANKEKYTVDLKKLQKELEELQQKLKNV